jgi:hypothetical protein
VAIATVDANATDVVLMGKLNGLLAESVRGRHVVGALQHQNQPTQSQDQEQRPDQIGAGPLIGTLPENLRHGSEDYEVDKPKHSTPVLAAQRTL